MLAFAPDPSIAFSDTHTVHDRLSCEREWSGTFAGPLRLQTGKLIDATGKRFTSRGVTLGAYDDAGKLTSHRDFWDMATLLHELDVPIG